MIQADKSATLATNNDQYLFQPTGRNGVIAIDKESYTSGVGFNRAPGITVGGPCATLQTNGVHAVCYDARGNGDGLKSSTITGDHENRITDYTSVVLEPQPVICMATQQGGAEIRTDDKAPTITAAAGMSGNNQPVICLQGNGIDRADTAGCNGKGWREDASYTLNTIDRPAVAYGLDRASFNQGQNAKFDFTVTEESQPTIVARGPGAVAQPIYNAIKASFFMRATENGSADTLVATDYKDPQLVAYGIDPGASRDVGDLFIEEQSKTITNGTCPGHHNGVVLADKPHYIVRRLTPTECARLQGFADRWGEVDAVDKLSQKDYQFWLEVRKTYDAINGREPKEYTVKQMLTWYNKLQTDSAEYKMWGNGIALPTALYVLQGIEDALFITELLGE